MFLTWFGWHRKRNIMILVWYLHSLSEDKALVGAASSSIAWMAGFTFCRKFIYIFVGANGDFPSIVKFNNYFHVISPAGRYQVCFGNCRPVSCKSLVVDFFVIVRRIFVDARKTLLVLKNNVTVSISHEAHNDVPMSRTLWRSQTMWNTNGISIKSNFRM